VDRLVRQLRAADNGVAGRHPDQLGMADKLARRVDDHQRPVVGQPRGGRRIG
jgi:hypothetical protein